MHEKEAPKGLSICADVKKIELITPDFFSLKKFYVKHFFSVLWPYLRIRIAATRQALFHSDVTGRLWIVGFSA
jgi:hypothetical protein